MSSQHLQRLASAALVLALANSTFAQTPIRYVSTCGSDANVGYTDNCNAVNTWDRPVRTIQRAIETLPNGGQIIVMPGTYPGGIDLGTQNYHIRGQAGPEETLIMPTPQTRGIIISGGQSNATIIEGLAIDGAIMQQNGAGMYILDSDPIIRNCIFSNNIALGHGAAIYADDCQLTVEQCVFIWNIATGGHRGGAVALEGSPTAFKRCRFERNTASQGGAVHVEGGGISRFTNCVLAWNESLGSGGALWLGQAGLEATNCTFYRNTAGLSGSAVHSTYGVATLGNCIAWIQSSSLTTGGPPAAVNATYCNVQFGYPGAGNMNIAPVFVNGEAGDLRLQSGSPCVDRGSLTLTVAAGVDTDFAGNPRAVDHPGVPNLGHAALGLAVDIGAYEYQPPTLPPSCPADIAPAGGDGAININDLLAVINAWGSCP